MTTDVAHPVAERGAAASQSRPVHAPQRRRLTGGGRSLVAQGEPIVWLNGGGLVICVAMIAGLLLFVLYQGITTFWPAPIVEIATVGGNVLIGEVTRDDHYELGYGSLTTMNEPRREAAEQLLNPRLHGKLQQLLADGDLQSAVAELGHSAHQVIVQAARLTPAVRSAPGAAQAELIAKLEDLLATRSNTLSSGLTTTLADAVAADQDGTQLVERWDEMDHAEQAWLAEADPLVMIDSLTSDPDLLSQVWGNEVLALLSRDAKLPMRRRLVRTGNFELTGEHFNWVSDFEVAEGDETRPEWTVLVERLAWGRFYGTPKQLVVDGKVVADQPAAVWAAFEEHHPEVRTRWRERRELETVDTGNVNRELEAARLDLRDVELQYGKESPQWASAHEAFFEKQQGLQAAFREIRGRIQQLDQENDRYQLVMQTADGQEKSIALPDVVRAYPANRLSWGQKLGVYLSRWWEFLSDDPREANSEGGVFPAIWGTVVMTMLMTVAVVPLGVLAALYLREYAKAGLLVSIVRIAVNNLAGVPSIVFGVFGLGFFCYIVGASIDQLFFEAKLPSPTFGTGGLMWASLTLALLTLPVVIVATEEALAAVPRSMREGSLACGATKWQTIRRIVLPRAMPGIMTGAILAMARGAGEVAPLMLVGAVKLAPELPLDSHFPFIHPERSFMHLGFHIYDLGFQSQNSEAAKPMVFTTTLLLIALIALMNLAAIWLRGRLRRKFEYNQF